MDNYQKRELRQLECNLDDLNPEFYPHLIDLLLGAGARDAWVTPIIMKLGRPACILSTLHEPQLEASLCKIIFENTTAIGLRCFDVQRYELERNLVEVETSWGKIPVKVAKDKSGKVLNVKPEVSACIELARRSGVTLKRLYQDLHASCEKLWK